MKPSIESLINSHGLISDQIDKASLLVILEKLSQIINSDVQGDIVELGCYLGTTSLFIQRLLNLSGSFKTLHVYDSFEGLPDKSFKDASAVGSDFKKGELKVSKKDLIRQFKKAGLRKPIIHKAWFNDLRDKDLPDTISFAFLDGDFYDSILVSLKLTWPRLSPGGIVCIDDYKREALPGVERAINDYFGANASIRKQASIGVITKPLT